jgi:hypothetical protein
VYGTRNGQWMQGRPDMARRQQRRLEELGASEVYLLSRDVVIAALFDDGDSLLATEAVAAAVRRLQFGAVQPEPASFAHRGDAFVVGLWSAHTGDTTTLRRVLVRLDAIAARTDSVTWAGTARLFADALRLISSREQPNRAVLESFDNAMRQGPPVSTPISETRSALNLIASRNWERLGDSRRAAQAAERATTWEPTPLVQFSALRDLGRTRLAAGDTAGAVRAWKDYLFWRNRAEPAQRKVDDEIRSKLADLERARK